MGGLITHKLCEANTERVSKARRMVSPASRGIADDVTTAAATWHNRSTANGRCAICGNQNNPRFHQYFFPVRKSETGNRIMSAMRCNFLPCYVTAHTKELVITVVTSVVERLNVIISTDKEIIHQLRWIHWKRALIQPQISAPASPFIRMLRIASTVRHADTNL